MKRALALLVVLCGTPAAAEEACVPSTAEASISIAKTFYEAFNKHDGNLLERAVAPDWVDVPPPPGHDPSLNHLQGMQAAFADLDQVFTNFYTTNDEFIVEANKVVVRSTASGVHSGEFLGLAPTGKTFSMTVIDIHTVCNGAIVKTEHVEDWLSALVQLGAVPLKPQ